VLRTLYFTDDESLYLLGFDDTVEDHVKIAMNKLKKKVKSVFFYTMVRKRKLIVDQSLHNAQMAPICGNDMNKEHCLQTRCAGFLNEIAMNFDNEAEVTSNLFLI